MKTLLGGGLIFFSPVINIFVQLGFSSNTVTLTSGGRCFDSLLAKLWSRLLCSLVAQTFNGVTDKKSSSILIY